MHWKEEGAQLRRRRGRKEILNTILSRAQKGFNNKRVIQETIINTLETVDYCKKNNIKGVLVSIDQSKAFNLVSHSFMEKVYTFFGFGRRIKNWLKSIGMSRAARNAHNIRPTGTF